MDVQARTSAAVCRGVISFEDPTRYVFLSTCLSQCQPGHPSADNDDRVLTRRCWFRHFIGVTRWRLGRHAGSSFDRNMLQGTFWYRGLVSAHLTAFCRANPVAGSFRVRRCSADLLRMHGDVSFGISKLFRHGFLQHFACKICRAIVQGQCLQQSGLISKLSDACLHAHVR